MFMLFTCWCIVVVCIAAIILLLCTTYIIVLYSCVDVLLLSHFDYVFVVSVFVLLFAWNIQGGDHNMDNMVGWFKSNSTNYD
jgi:hypothetical protein